MQSEPKEEVHLPRLYRPDVIQFKADLAFNGEKREGLMIFTAYGHKLTRLIDIVMLTYEGDPKTPHNLYRKIYKNYPSLHHGERMLTDHIQVLFHISKQQFDSPK